VCFDHARPWGSLSLLPLWCPVFATRGPLCPDAGARFPCSRLPAGSAGGGAEASLRGVAAAPAAEAVGPASGSPTRSSSPRLLPRPLARALAWELLRPGLPRCGGRCGEPHRSEVGPRIGVASAARSGSGPRISHTETGLAGHGPLRTRCAPRRFASRRPGGSRLPAFPVLPGPSTPRGERSGWRRLPATRTRINL